MTFADSVLGPEIRRRPAGFAPVLVDTGETMEWVPPDHSLCRRLGFHKSGDEAQIARLREALIESAWQALEIERITGRPPSGYGQ